MHATAGIDTGPKEKNWSEKEAQKCHLYLHSYPLLRPELELKIVPTGKSGTELITTLRGCSSPSTTRTVVS